MTWSYPTGFSVSQAITYANFVQQAYFQYYVLANTPPDFGYPPFSKFMQLPPTGYQLLYNIWYDEGIINWDPVYFGYVARLQSDSTQAVIAIRGTENAEEWTDDILYSTQVNSPILNSEGLVHSGFATIYNGQGAGDGLLYYTAPSGTITPPLQTDKPVPLATVLSGVKNVTVTGHSLGAALAVLLTLDIALNIKIHVTSYNFASPMVGDPVFANCFNQQIGPISENYRVANGMDPVPNLPSNVFYAPDSSQEWDYMQVNGYCPVDSGILSVVADPHSLSNYVIGLNNLSNPPKAVTVGKRGSAGLRSIPRWQDKIAAASERAA
jgi:hypothetical protein